MEQLLHYCWKHKMLPLDRLLTTDGRPVEVIDPGLHNHHAGPDFFNAKVKINDTLWVGNVEIHVHGNDWYLHGHDHDPAYDNVVLHVCEIPERDVRNSKGMYVPQLQVSVPQRVRDHYEALLHEDRYPPCYQIVPHLPQLQVHSWLSALQTERLERKTTDIARRVARCDGSWEDAYFVTLARNCGFGVNSDAFEAWALNMPLSAVVHHRDDLLQVEALFLGQAGLLDIATVPARYQEAALGEGYFTQLRNEYLFLAHKFGLKPTEATQWRFLRMRPQNFPHIRIVQLAKLYVERRTGLRQLVDCTTAEQLRELYRVGVTPYWETHYTFGSESVKNAKRMSPSSVNLLLINTAIPMMFAYGRHKGDEQLCERAFDLLEQLRAENNNIVRMWSECGLHVSTAGDSQALIQLKKEYCDRKDCLRCRFGYEYMKSPQKQPFTQK